jgi:hypothetical protein
MFESCRTLELSKDWAQIPVGQKLLESISSTQGSRGSGTESAASISINSNAPSAASGLRRQKARKIGHVSQFNLQLVFFLQLFAAFAFGVRWRFPVRSTSAQLDTMPDRHLQRDSLFLLFSLKRG